MKIVSYVLNGIGGIEIFPIISLVIFFSLFAFMFYHVFKLDKASLKELRDLPLDNKK